MVTVSTCVFLCLLIGAWLLIHTLYVKTTLVKLSLPHAPAATLVHLTDLHGRTRFLNGPLHRLVNRHAPDLVMVTGDLAQHGGQLQQVLAGLAEIRVRDGMFFVPGNYEQEEIRGLRKRKYSSEAYALNRDEWAKKMIVLENEGVLLEKDNRQLLIYGFDHSTYGNERYTWQPSQKADMTIVLAHSPNIISLIRREGINSDLLLTGHTHGGQIRLCGKAMGAGAYRHFHVGQKPDETAGLFSISRGLGTTKLPIRLNCFPEITVYQINQEKKL